MKKLRLALAISFPLIITLLFQNCSDEVHFSSSSPDMFNDFNNQILDVVDDQVDGIDDLDPIIDNNNSSNTLPPPTNDNTKIPSYKKVEEIISLTSISDKVDILFVVDNSKSMKEEQKNMKDRIDGFINKITHLDWQIAVTSTDPRNSEKWGDGKFRTFGNGNSILKSIAPTM